MKRVNPKLTENKIMYQMFIERKVTNNDSVRGKWEKTLDREITSMMWSQVMLETKLITKSTKLQYFQYKLNNCVLTTYVQISKWNKEQSPNCTFCNKEQETYLHLFYKCAIVNKIWKCLQKWLYYYCYVELNLDPYEIMFNKYKDSFPGMVNTIILIMKHYIFRSKCLKEKLEFVKLITYISEIKSLEYMAAKGCKKLLKCYEKWLMYDKV